MAVEEAKMSRGREEVAGATRGAGVLLVVLVTLFSPSVAGHCRSHVSVTGEASLSGDTNTLFVRLPLRETEHVGRLLYRVMWDEAVTPSITEQEDFVRYFHVDVSVEREWTVSLKRSLIGLPDYPSLKTNITASVIFPAFSDGDECSVFLSHLLHDNNTQEPTVEASNWFLQVAKDFPVSTPLQGLTVTATDNDAAKPNNQMEVAVGGACPLEAEARQYGGVAGQDHLVSIHLTSPLNDLVNKTFTCTLKVTDMGSPPLSSLVTFSLHVVEEEVPTTITTATTPTTTTTATTLPQHLTLPLYLAEAWPGMEVGSLLNTFPAPIKVNRGDTTLSQVTYTLRDAWTGVNGSAYFAINSTTGQVWLARELDGRWAAEGGGSFVPLVIQAQDSSGRITSAVLQVTIKSSSISHTSPYDPQPVSSRHPASPSYTQRPPASPSYTQRPPASPSYTQRPPASPSYTQPSTQPASSSDCLCSFSRSKGRTRLTFTRLSYAAEVFSTDTFVGRVEAWLEGRLGLVSYSWAPETHVTNFVLNSVSGVITVAPPGVSQGSHLLSVRATAGNLTATAQVSVRVLEEKKKEEEEKEEENENRLRRLRSNNSSTCDPGDLEALQVAVGVLGALLGVILLAAGVGGVLLYRRRRARARTEVKHISTLGSVYPNLSFSRESQE